jgi:hypothetical protein
MTKNEKTSKIAVLVRENYYMKNALRDIKKACRSGSLVSIAEIVSNLEKIVELK